MPSTQRQQVPIERDSPPLKRDPLSDRTHRIRLQGPWDVAGPFADDRVIDETANWRRIRIPATWQELFGDQSGVAWFRRTFNAPTGVEEGDRLFLEIGSGSGRLVRAELNGVSLAQLPVGDCHRLEITESIQEFNTLVVGLGGSAALVSQQPGGLWQPVILLIEHA